MLAPAAAARLSRIGNEFGEFGNHRHLNATTLLKYNKASKASQELHSYFCSERYGQRTIYWRYDAKEDVEQTWNRYVC
jgi:hypothetical protein